MSTKANNSKPGDDRPADNKNRRHPEPKPAGHRPPNKLLSEEDCVSGLSQLPGMITLGFFKPAQSNAVRAAYRDILDYYERRSKNTNAAAPLSTDDVLEMLHVNPKLLNLFAPFLNDEQLQRVTDEIAGNQHQGDAQAQGDGQAQLEGQAQGAEQADDAPGEDADG